MRFSRFMLFGVLTLLMGLFMSSAAIAQDATPAATPGGPSEGFPVAVHQGTCDNPTAEPAFDVGNAIAPGVEDGEPETVGQVSGAILLQTSGTLDISLDDLANQGHVLAVHASPDDYETIVACGQIAGIKDEGKLAIALSPVGGSTTVGVAILDEDTSGVLGLGDDQVQATVYVFDTLPPSEDAGTPAS